VPASSKCVLPARCSVAVYGWDAVKTELVLSTDIAETSPGPSEGIKVVVDSGFAQVPLKI